MRPEGLIQASVAHNDGQLHAVGGIQLGQGAGYVGFHGGFAHVELTGYFGVGLPAPDPGGDLVFAFGNTALTAGLITYWAAAVGIAAMRRAPKTDQAVSVAR